MTEKKCYRPLSRTEVSRSLTVRLNTRLVAVARCGCRGRAAFTLKLVSFAGFGLRQARLRVPSFDHQRFRVDYREIVRRAGFGTLNDDRETDLYRQRMRRAYPMDPPLTLRPLGRVFRSGVSASGAEDGNIAFGIFLHAFRF